MNITADQFTLTKVGNTYYADLKTSKMKYHSFSQMQYVIEIHESADSATKLLGNIYKTVGVLELILLWDDRMKLHEELESMQDE